MDIRILIFDESEKIIDCITGSLVNDPLISVMGFSGGLIGYREKILRTIPDVVIMDIEIGGADMMGIIRDISLEFPLIKILIVTAFADDDRVYNAIYAGALGYILKDQPLNSLSVAIKELCDGGAPMSPAIARKVLNLIQHRLAPVSAVQPNNYHLTLRENQVLHSLVQGKSYKMIGHQLHISYETVRSHMKKIYQKLGAASLTEVVAKAIKEKVV